MFEECKNIILDNWIKLIKDCNGKELAKKLTAKKVFTDKEIKDIFSTADDRHNKRTLFFKIMDKEQFAFNSLLEALNESNQHALAKLLKSQSKVFIHTCTPTVMPVEEQFEYETIPDTGLYAHVDKRTTPLEIKVVHSETFQDTKENCKEIKYYYSRSNDRGRVLIVNNYDYSATREKEEGHADRKGALVDASNLKELFGQMGGWNIELHENKTSDQLLAIVKDFTAYREDKLCDICFVIIMSHGQEELNKSTVVGIDGSYIYTSDIEELFTNRNCSLFKGKPKVFLYQMCRGSDIDIAMRQVTETDSILKTNRKVRQHLRDTDDMLVGHSTLQGRKAHRDPYRGSWYIEFICDVFMRFANRHPVDDMLGMVDDRLGHTMSEARTMQTPEVNKRGFKKLYLNPGIYADSDGGVVRKYFE